jgi:transcriptional regulator with XRE-family HTH domain
VSEDICVRLGARIRELRKQRGWRQLDLAEHSGVHEVHISDLERGTREICFRNLAALAQGLGVTLSELLTGIDAQGPHNSQWT